jgi:hypothetical protein
MLDYIWVTVDLEPILPARHLSIFILVDMVRVPWPERNYYQPTGRGRGVPVPQVSLCWDEVTEPPPLYANLSTPLHMIGGPTKRGEGETSRLSERGFFLPRTKMGRHVVPAWPGCTWLAAGSRDQLRVHEEFLHSSTLTLTRCPISCSDF